MIHFDVYSFPKNSGVYFFKNDENKILYIGKAKNLHKRLISYNTDKQIDWKIKYLIEKSKKIEWIETISEKEALLLEANLISTHKPICNKLLTSYTPFSYIVFRKKIKTKNLVVEISRNHNQKKDFIIGPFLRKKDAIKLYQYIISLFSLGTCKKKINTGCLHYHLGMCSGTCLEKFDEKGYKKRYHLAISAIKNAGEFYKNLEKEIKKAEKKFNFKELEKLYSYQLEYNELLAYIEKISNQEFHHTIEDKILSILSEEEIYKEAIIQLKDILELECAPQIIDCIDISHFQGSAVSGAVVRFVDGKYDFVSSKSYPLKTNSNDDYKNLQILVTTHYKDNKEQTPADLPDILLIDGGKGQLHAIKKLKIETKIMALAKKEELLFILHPKKELILTPKASYGKILIALRNATHNAAIRLHHRIREKELFN